MFKKLTLYFQKSCNHKNVPESPLPDPQPHPALAVHPNGCAVSPFWFSLLYFVLNPLRIRYHAPCIPLSYVNNTVELDPPSPQKPSRHEHIPHDPLPGSWQPLICSLSVGFASSKHFISCLTLPASMVFSEFTCISTGAVTEEYPRMS